MEGFKSVCDRYEWIPQDRTFSDLGISAFEGNNRLKGELAEFMTLAKDNRLAEYPVLVLESLDRFSRQDIDESEPAVMDLLRAGVAIHVKFTGQTFTRTSTVELGDRIQILVALKAAHNYSMQLSERVKSAKDKKLERFANGETVNLSDYAPRWIQWNKDTKQLELNDRAKAVRIIFAENIKGNSLASICRTLHADNIPSFLNGHWTKQTVRKILSNPATYGDFRGKLIFPKVVSKEDFEAVQINLSRNAGVKLAKGEKAKEGQTFGRRGRASKHINIFRGLVRCSECGHSMEMNNGRNHAYYRCGAKIHGACNNGYSVRVSDIEENIVCGLLQVSPEDLLASHDKSIALEISNLTAERDSLTKKINALLDLAGVASSEEINAKGLPLKSSRDAIDKKLSDLQGQSKAASHTPANLSTIKKLIGGNENDIDKALGIVQGQLVNPDTRAKLANIMPQVIKNVVVTENHTFAVHYVAGGSHTDYLLLDTVLK